MARFPAVAVVGAGRMGAAMAGRLRRSGAEVVVFNRTRAKAEAVAAQTGAATARSARGEAADLERARPVLDVLAARVLHVGGLGAGATMKLAVNAVVHSLNLALAEA